MIQLGQKYRDKITGFTDTATGFVTYYISGCNQALITPIISKDGAMKDSQWIGLKPEGNKVIKLNNDETPGFDCPAPKR